MFVSTLLSCYKDNCKWLLLRKNPYYCKNRLKIHRPPNIIWKKLNNLKTIANHLFKKKLWWWLYLLILQSDVIYSNTSFPIESIRSSKFTWMCVAFRDMSRKTYKTARPSFSHKNYNRHYCLQKLACYDSLFIRISFNGWFCIDITDLELYDANFILDSKKNCFAKTDVIFPKW